MANPPITIGELIDVPAAGSPIGSAWAQEATNRIVHRFANSATRDAQFTNRLTGVLAYSIDTRRLCMWDGVGWLILSEYPTVVPAGSPNTIVWPHSNGASSTKVGASGWTSNTTVAGQYVRAAGLCHTIVDVTMGTAGVLRRRAEPPRSRRTSDGTRKEDQAAP